MAVERIVTGVDHGAGEPAAVKPHGRIEHLVGGLDPVDLARRLAPKALGVRERAGMNLMIPAVVLDVHDVAPRGSRSTLSVMPGLSRPKDGVASARLCPGIHVFVLVDEARRGWPGRARPGRRGSNRVHSSAIVTR